jgi:lipopolysaccharide transport system ATP-binding protein
MNDDVLIAVEGVSKKFCGRLKRSLWYGLQDTIGDMLGLDSSEQRLRQDEFWAVNDVSFELRRGECLGLIGRNGAGKTTLLKMLNGLIKPDRGRIEIRGHVGALIALGAGFNQILTGRENIYINGAVLGLSRRDIDRKIDDIIDFAEIGDFIDAPVQSYSSGMQVRLGFAVATALEPDVLLLDEVLAVGDAAFRAKCFHRIGKVLNKAAVIFVSHNEEQVYRICNRVMLLANGSVIKQGAPEAVLAAYRLGEEHIRPSQTTIADKHVVGMQFEVDRTTVQYGDELRISAIVDSDSRLSVGAVFVHFWRHGQFVANGNITFVEDDALILGIGKSELRVSLRSLNLEAGKYSISFAALDETLKRTILQSLHFGEIEIHGSVSSGPPYLVPMTINLVDGDTSDGCASTKSSRFFCSDSVVEI